eukprot:gene5213-3733_t
MAAFEEKRFNLSVLLKLYDRLGTQTRDCYHYLLLLLFHLNLHLHLHIIGDGEIEHKTMNNKYRLRRPQHSAAPASTPTHLLVSFTALHWSGVLLTSMLYIPPFHSFIPFFFWWHLEPLGMQGG